MMTTPPNSGELTSFQYEPRNGGGSGIAITYMKDGETKKEYFTTYSASNDHYDTRLTLNLQGNSKGPGEAAGCELQLKTEGEFMTAPLVLQCHPEKLPLLAESFWGFLQECNNGRTPGVTDYPVFRIRG